MVSSNEEVFSPIYFEDMYSEPRHRSIFGVPFLHNPAPFDSSTPPPNYITTAPDFTSELSDYSTEDDRSIHNFSRTPTFEMNQRSVPRGHTPFGFYHQPSRFDERGRHGSPTTSISSSSYSPQTPFSQIRSSFATVELTSPVLFESTGTGFATSHVEPSSLMVSTAGVHNAHEHCQRSIGESYQAFSDVTGLHGHIHSRSYDEGLFPLDLQPFVHDHDHDHGDAESDSDDLDTKMEESPPTSTSPSEHDSEYQPARRKHRRNSRSSSKTNSPKSPTKIIKRRLSDSSRRSTIKQEVTEPPQPTSLPQGQGRPYPCPLRPYGCPSTFTSKNEWKRHVNVQHVNLYAYRCDICPKAQHHDFNRKDLFTQHLDRMHATRTITITSKQDKSRGSGPAARQDKHDWSQVHNRSWVQIRQPPLEIACVFCEEPAFHGDGSFDRWLEHIGRHLAFETKRNTNIDPSAYDDKWSQDGLFRDWLLREGFLVMKNGVTSLANKNSKARGRLSRGVHMERDADGDME